MREQPLRFNVGTDEAENLQVIQVNFDTLSAEQRKLLRNHLDDGMDVWAWEWSRLRDGQRTEHSEVIRSSRRITATSATLAALIAGIEANEREIAHTRTFQNSTAVHA